MLILTYDSFNVMHATNTNLTVKNPRKLGG